MKVTVPLLVISLCMTVATFAADSVVLGHGIRNYFLSMPPCPKDADSGLTAICMDGNYVWVLKAQRTLVGPRVAGTVRAISSQHGAAVSEFVKSVELFVLTPIDDLALRKSSHADYYIVELSPRYSDDRYCLSDKPTDVGLHVDQADITIDATGYNCFRAQLVGAGPPNLRWNRKAQLDGDVQNSR